MGSGCVMNIVVWNAMSFLDEREGKEFLESLGTDFMINVFGDSQLEDFETRSQRGAELAREAVRRDFEKRYGKDYPFSVDVVESGGYFKISFFK